MWWIELVTTKTSLDPLNHTYLSLFLRPAVLKKEKYRLIEPSKAIISAVLCLHLEFPPYHQASQKLLLDLTQWFGFFSIVWKLNVLVILKTKDKIETHACVVLFSKQVKSVVWYVKLKNTRVCVRAWELRMNDL